MTASLTDALCTRCALCCDGSLFADVELSGPKEATGLEILGLAIEDDDADGSVLSLPCTALRGTRCGIYAHRPETCRTFECRLLQDAQRGAVSVEQAQKHIAGALAAIGRVKGLLDQLGQRDARLPIKERCADALARATPANPDVSRKRTELEAAMSAVEALMRKTFLHGRAVVESKVAARSSIHPNVRRWSMGDKNPKSIERQKKQNTVNKNQKKSDAFAKAHPAPAVPGKKGKG